MSKNIQARPLFDPPIVRRAMIDAVLKLDPRRQLRNPVMFTVLVGSVLTTALGLHALQGGSEESPAFIFGISLWLWFTVLFANFAEAMAEGRGKAQAATLRKMRTTTTAVRIRVAGDTKPLTPGYVPGSGDTVAATELRRRRFPPPASGSYFQRPSTHSRP